LEGRRFAGGSGIVISVWSRVVVGKRGGTLVVWAVMIWARRLEKAPIMADWRVATTIGGRAMVRVESAFERGGGGELKLFGR
jgi:hypothetical protein